MNEFEQVQASAIVVTAIIALLTLIANFAISMITEHNKRTLANIEFNKVIIPKIRQHLCILHNLYIKLSSNTYFVMEYSNCTNNAYLFVDERSVRDNFIDGNARETEGFLTLVMQINSQLSAIRDYFDEHPFPRVSMPIQRKLSALHSYTHYVKAVSDNPMDCSEYELKFSFSQLAKLISKFNCQ